LAFAFHESICYQFAGKAEYFFEKVDLLGKVLLKLAIPLHPD
jgi:hypothetical protein